ncbi:DUF5081 family protein [Bacillus sp. JCM 19034]|uniref:DUF5081 family protein n=1 Tax=Bacillus sp. JCM 19034 TaxID=1481928 RepID=UPI000785B3B5|nr:DUF5081 family protein [Bacillus sp. JCM 19034]
MMSTKTDTDLFSVPELYLLASAFGGNDLFGLPDKKIYQLKGEAPFEQAHYALKEKGVLTEEGKLTKSGAVMIQTLQAYYNSKKFVRIHNALFSFQEERNDDVTFLLEEEEQLAYKLMVMAKPFLLKMLSEKLPIILREPHENEITFLKERVSDEERIELERYEPNDQFMNLEIFHLEEEPRDITNPNFYQQWLIFTKQDQLIMVDTVTKTYYYASQYYFMKVLFDALEFPYKEAQ